MPDGHSLRGARSTAVAADVEQKGYGAVLNAAFLALQRDTDVDIDACVAAAAANALGDKSDGAVAFRPQQTRRGETGDPVSHV
ncbi:MAG: hypothetical protein ACOYM5_13215, partial [Caulobacter sp.]